MSQEPRSRTNTVAKELALANAHISRWVAGTVASLVHFGDEYLACFVTTEILRKHHMTARDLVDLGARRVKLSLVVTVEQIIHTVLRELRLELLLVARHVVADGHKAFC